MNRPSDDKNCRVLIIEDNRQIHEEFRKILAPVPSVTAEKNALRSRGFEVDSADQNQEGILLVEKAVAAGRPYAVVFVDVGVSPGWEGRETARRIWERDPRLQMVICTAGSDYSWKDGMSGKLGQHDGWLILRKPFDAVEARQLAQALTEKWRLHQLAREKMEALEGLVAARTSELQRSEAVLRESEQCFSGAFEHAPIGLALVSTEGRWLKVNRALCDLTGYSGEELLARSFKDITFPEDLGKDLEQMRRLIGGEIKFYQTEKRYVHRDGHLITVLLSVSIVRDEQGSPLYFVSQTMDITGRKQAEEQVRESQERYRSLIDTAGDAIFTIAPDGTFTSLNPAVEAMAGISRADWIGKSFAPMVHPEDLALAREMFLRVMRGEPAPVHELRGNPGLARPARMEMTLTAQKDGAGKIIGVLGIGRDITERRRLEEKLFQSQKLETVGRLAGGIAHEFNSILTAIIGQSELLLGDLPSQGPLAKSANEIHLAANRAAALTRQLLAYGRKQILQPESLDLNRVIAGMDGVFQHLMGANVATRIIATPGLRMVKADAGQVEQVIMNLAMNARDAMPNGGQFILETGNVVIDPETVGRYPELKPGNYVMLAVTDTGCGMTAEVKARVFEPFFSTKNFGQATGLGLSTCYGIIKQSGGHISIYSEPSRGATFKVYLPQSEEATTAAPVRRLDAPELPRGTETILLVEDDPALREMAAILLRRLGYTILAAANGIEALSLKQQSGVGHIDLLFTDVVMPHMSGKELADRVRRLHPHTRILFTSAYTENAIVHQGMLTRGTALLSKPFTPMALANKLREVLDQAGGELPIGD
jgi:two-component system cell cycle sensor histidine kinase/response regulator CckA